MKKILFTIALTLTAATFGNAYAAENALDDLKAAAPSILETAIVPTPLLANKAPSH